MSFLSGLGNIFSGMFSGGAGTTTPTLSSGMLDKFSQPDMLANTQNEISGLTDLQNNGIENFNFKTPLKVASPIQASAFQPVSQSQLNNNPTLTADSGKDGGILSGLGDMFTGENILKGIEMWQAKKNDDRNYEAYKTQVNNNAQKDNNKRDRSKHVSKSMYGTTDEGISGKDMEYIG